MIMTDGDSFWRLTARRESAALRELTFEQKGEIRAAQIDAIFLLTPTMIAANSVNAAIVAFLYWEPETSAFLTAWACLFGCLIYVWRGDWARMKARGKRQGASARTCRRMTFSALVFGLIWAAPFLWMFHIVGDAHRVVLTAISAGMICGGAMVLATVWQAALVFSLAIVLPTMVTLLFTGDPIYIGLAALCASFSAVVSRTVCVRSDSFVDSHIVAMKLREQGHVISLLLKEFEENASDWLWQIDAEGRLVHASNRMAVLLGQPQESLIGRSALRLFITGGPRLRRSEAACLTQLRNRFSEHETIHDLVLPLFIRGEQRYWSISAKPIYSSANEFCGYRGVGSDITDARRAEASLEKMASFDGLTGLPNRAHFHSRITQALARLEESKEEFAVISIDLDRFKNVNDTLGHHVGDLLLSDVARRLNECVRSQDVVARFGGDEFVILQLDAAGPEDSASLAKRIVNSLSQPYSINGQCVLIGASVGIALAPKHGADADDLLRNSDLALYRAKSEGKGDFRYFSDEMNAVMQSRRLMEIELREALASHAFELHFQPLIDAATGVVTTCETLVRWRHPTRGLISPAEFIPVAEETGLILALGEWVLRNACIEALAWPEHIRLAVNLSSIQFQASRVADLVAAALAETGLPAARLELEITETVLLANSEATLEALRAIRASGVSISLDDFGTGYSSLSYLTSFRFDKIKIDKSFVRDVAQRPDAAAVIQAITGLASSLGMCTTAEGVESNEELDWLRQQGCQEIQGFLFSRPLPAHDLRALLGIRSANCERTGFTARLSAA